MQNLMSAMARLATPEVFTVMGLIVATYVGWKGVSKGIGLGKVAFQKMSFLGLTAALLFAGGVGTTGFGLGDLASRYIKPGPIEPQPTLAEPSVACHRVAKFDNRGQLVSLVDYPGGDAPLWNQSSGVQQPLSNWDYSPYVAKEKLSAGDAALMPIQFTFGSIAFGSAMAVIGFFAYLNRPTRR